MKSRLAAAVAALVTVAAAAPAAADPQKGLYVSGAVTRNHLRGPDVNLTDLTARLGYRVNRVIAIETEASIPLASDKKAGARFKLKDEYAAYVMAIAPVGARMELFVRGGLGSRSFHFSSPAGAASIRDKTRNYGVGVMIGLTEDDRLRADITRQDAKPDGLGHNHDITTLGLGWVHAF